MIGGVCRHCRPSERGRKQTRMATSCAVWVDKFPPILRPFPASGVAACASEFLCPANVTTILAETRGLQPTARLMPTGVPGLHRAMPQTRPQRYGSACCRSIASVVVQFCCFLSRLCFLFRADVCVHECKHAFGSVGALAHLVAEKTLFTHSGFAVASSNSGPNHKTPRLPGYAGCVADHSAEATGCITSRPSNNYQPHMFELRPHNKCSSSKPLGGWPVVDPRACHPIPGGPPASPKEIANPMPASFEQKLNQATGASKAVRTPRPTSDRAACRPNALESMMRGFS
jgi:hypothetical protein